MRNGNFKLFLAGMAVCSTLFLAGCNWGYTTWNDKTISVSGESGGMQISTADEAAKVVLGQQTIVFTENSVTLNDVRREVTRYKKVAVTERSGSVQIMLDGARIF